MLWFCEKKKYLTSETQESATFNMEEPKCFDSWRAIEQEIRKIF